MYGDMQRYNRRNGAEDKVICREMGELQRHGKSGMDVMKEYGTEDMVICRDMIGGMKLKTR